MFGNGVLTGMMPPIIKTVPVTIPKDPKKANIKSLEAAPGTSHHEIFSQQDDSTTVPPSPLIILDFAASKTSDHCLAKIYTAKLI